MEKGGGAEVSAGPSELTWLESCKLPGKEETSSKDSPVRESLAKEWTDEKHSLYLESMEVAFVNQLYDSMGFLGSQHKNATGTESTSEIPRERCTPSGQFKVLRSGCWKRVNFDRHESRLNKKDESHEVLSNPWIRHFRPLARGHVLASQSPEACRVSCRQMVVSDRMKQMAAHHSSGSSSSLNNVHFCGQDLTECGKEVSDQNFVDEEVITKKASNVRGSRKGKILKVKSQTHYQVVRRPPA